MNTVRVGWLQKRLTGPSRQIVRCHDSLEAVTCVVDTGHARHALLAIDLVQLSVSACDVLRSKVSGRCSLNAQNIWIHCTHTHAGPEENLFRQDDFSLLAERLGDLITQAAQQVQPMRISYHTVDTGAGSTSIVARWFPNCVGL